MTIINYRDSGQAGCIQLHTGVEVREMEPHSLPQQYHRQADRMILVQQRGDHSSQLEVLEVVVVVVAVVEVVLE